MQEKLSPTAIRRREEILAAARRCFRKQGFHGASMGAIAREFGMSIGHIYNYFESKEAIIEAIVEQWTEEYIRTTTFSWNADAVTRKTQTREGFRRELEIRLHSLDMPLFFEIMAEISRNPKIAACVREADRKSREHVRKLMLQVCRDSGKEPPADLDSRMCVLSAVLEGMCVRYAANPGLDVGEVVELIADIAEHLGTEMPVA